jgi:uncharacterized protein YhaN
MRLTSFSLKNYGNFADVRLPLDPRPGLINLVVAPNGGGKTVLRNAFHDWLFGIPGQTKMAFRFGYGGMGLLAEGIDGNGAAFAIGRRKGIGNPLIDAQGNSLDRRMLDRLIGEADEALFERLFALDTDLLRRGATSILNTGGDLAEALFAAGSGIASLRRLREQFDASRDELAPGRRVTSRPFYQALGALAQARSDLHTATVRPQAWNDLRGTLDFTRERLSALARKQAERQAEIGRLQRVKRVRPWLEKLQGARHDCADATGAPRLPADTEARWQRARGALAPAEQDLRNATDQLRQITVSIAGEQPDHKMLEQGERIDALERRRERITADLRDLPRRETEHSEAVAQLDQRLTALGGESFDAIAAVMPNSPQIAEARDLIKQHGVLSERLRKAEAEVTENEREIASAERELDELGEPEDTSNLSALVGETRADGDPARRLEDLGTRFFREEGRLKAALAKVPLWDRDLEALAAVVPPTRQSTNRTAGALDAAKHTVGEAERELKRLRGERDEAGERLAREREGQAVPDSAAIAAARAHRDLGWSLIRRSKFEGEALEAEIAAYGAPFGLATVFERSLSDADELADRRDGESQRLARIAERERIIAGLDSRLRDAQPRLDEARHGQEAASREWASVAGAFGFGKAPEAADLRDIITARQSVLDVRAARDEAQQAFTAESQRQGAARRRFAKLLPEEKCGSLPEALAAAQQVVDRCTEAKRQRDGIEARRTELRRLRQQAADERDAADEAFAKWEADWQACLARLNRPLSETPAAVERAIELITEAHQHHQERRRQEHRIAGMKGNIAEFESEVTDLTNAVAPDLAGQPAEIAVKELRHRLEDHQKIETRRDQLVEQGKEVQSKLTEATDNHRTATAIRESLRVEIGGDSDEEIQNRIALAARRASAEEQLQEIKGKLAELGDNLPIDALEREAAATPAETVDSELVRLQADASQISEDRENAAREEQRLGDELRKIEAGVDAIDAEERRQAAIAWATRISAEALLYHAAGCLLRHGMDRLRDFGEGGLVRRIGEVFRRITGGTYAGVTADEDDKGTPFLIAIEADGTTTKRVEQLSDGNRDQLFLALRFVMVEDYAQKAPALPFIADDLLQTFDDYGRTANALAAFADLSQHVQVIVLSHHRQVIEVAKTLPTGTVNVCELAA